MSKIASEQDPDFWETVWPVICVDFDGVLNKYAGWTGKYEEYEARPGMRTFLKALKARDYFVVILTARPYDNLHTVEKWFSDNQAHDLIDMITNVKCPAEVYIDDRAINFNGEYHFMLYEIEHFRPHWKPPDTGQPNVWGN